MGGYRLWLAKVLTILVLIIALPILLGVLAGAGDSKHKVAVIQLEGVITDASDTLASLF